MVRGVDLLCSTPQQLYLQQLLGLPHPRYAHVPLLVAQQNRRLSKRDHDAGMEELLERFGSPKALIGHIAKITGIAPDCEEAAPEDLLKVFDVKQLPGLFPDLVQTQWH